MKQCAKGHIYDESRNTSCPYCDGSAVGVTMPLNQPIPAAVPAAEPEFPKTAPIGSNAAYVDNPTPQRKENQEMSATVALSSTEVGMRPVVGWLVVIEGEKKGTAFTVYPEKNYIGRGIQFDINVNFDKAISKEGDAVLIYDSKHTSFFMTTGQGKNNVYVNSDILLQPMPIKDYDVIEVGSTKFVFRSLCNSEFTYE